MDMYKKGDCLTVTIEDLDTDGQGIGKADGYTLFVKDALVGDVVKVKIMKAKKNYAFARLEEVITPSSYRIEPKCEHHRRCGGCQLQCLSYEAQLAFKEKKVRNNLMRIGGFPEEKISEVMQPIIGMEVPFYYRNKAQYPIGTDKKTGKPVAGFYAQRTHDIIANTDCALGVSENKIILEKILAWMEECRVSAYDEITHNGLVRHVLIRKGFVSGELMVCLVVNGRELPQIGKLIESLKEVPGMKSISLSVNRENTNVIMGTTIRTLWGNDTIEDTLGGIKFRISPLSFYQVNPVQTEKLYAKAVEFAGLTGKETVWDLYCGIGTISLFMAKNAGKVYGVEIIPEAIEDAKGNAERNGFTNTEFFVGKAEEVLPKFYERVSREGDTKGALFGEQIEENVSGSDRSLRDAKQATDMLHPDVIVVDPPRKGCDVQCLDTMLKMQPKRIVYVSCDSATLARDLKILCEGGYELKKAVCVDMFGQTGHVETVVLLSQQKPDDVIEVEIELDELDLTSAESKATYAEIKDYVLKEHGLKVSNLYISQVKRKCGIEVGENYNLPKSEDSRQPQCPEEKEKAIKDALEHFGMV
ncbi:MAG: 23S rRNA (uracil(1939)-C(5))-methyltransferase RlmD [Lachnospiraceae bacterium]|nr:23S rRNA (uracil(1939)-C(5))-methyltransferase RlmD [Lachnospiraceae bacterium]